MLLPSFPEIPPHLLRVARPLTFQPDEIIRCKGTHADTVYILLAYLRKKLPACDAAVRFPMRRQDIVDAIGTSLKTVNRSVDRLRAEGLLSLDRGKLALTPEQCAKVRAMNE